MKSTFKPGLLFTACLAGGFLFYPKAAMNGAYEALILWAGSVFPSLFPFCAAVFLFRSLGGMAWVGHRLQKLPSGPLLAPTFAGWCGGYPTGAILAGGEKNPSVRRMLLALSLCSGPAFILGTVGTSILKSARLGLLLLASHYLGAVINCLLLRDLSRPESVPCPPPRKSFGSALTDSVESALYAMLRVLGFMCLMKALYAVLEGSGAIHLLLSFLPMGAAGKDLAQALLSGVFEMSLGLSALGELQLPLYLLLPTMAFLLGFGGLSVLLQALSFLPEGPGFLSLFWLKLRHGMLSCLLTVFLCRLLPGELLFSSAIPTLSGDTLLRMTRLSLVFSGLMAGGLVVLGLAGIGYGLFRRKRL